MKKLGLALSSALVVSLAGLSAFAQEMGAATPMGNVSNAYDQHIAAMIAAALAISIAAFGGALGQGRIGAAALEGIARNPGASGKIQTPMILGLALVESLVLYAFVIAFLVYNK